MIKPRTIFSWLAAAMVFATIGACTDEIVIPDSNLAEAGGDVAIVNVSLSNCGYSAIQTRSSFIWGESELKDVQLVIVDESTGAIINKYANTSSQIGALSFTGTVGHTYDIWAAANLGGKITVSELNDFITGNKTVSYSDIASKGIPMYSEATDNTPGPARITVSGNGDVVIVDMVRMLARVDLKVNKSELDNPSGFTVKDVKIYNAINTYAPFTADVKQAHSGSIDYSFDHASSSDVSAINGGGTISLYAFENMQGTLLPGNTDQWKKVPSQISGSADYCTYLELEGSYTNAGKTFGKVIYRMYLGNDLTTNFDVKRNTKYTVTLYPSEEEIDGHRGSWRIESSDYDDDRSLEFSPRSVIIECLTNGSTSVVRSPSDLEYNFSYSAAEAAAAGVTITKTGDNISIVSTVAVTENKTVTLHVETPDGVHKDDCIVTVTPPSVVEGKDYEIIVSANPQSILVGGTTALSATLYEYKTVNGVRSGAPAPVSGVSFTWMSESPAVLGVNGSTGTGVSAGTAMVSATCSYGGRNITSEKIPITVGNDIDYILEITPSSTTLGDGESAQFTAKYYVVTNGVKDSGIDVTALSNTKWDIVSGGSYVKCDDKDKGKFTWIAGAGTAIIKATYNGKEATATINTTAHVPVITYELVITPATTTLNENESVQFTAIYYIVTDNIRDGGKDVTNSATWSIVSGGSYVKYDDKGDKGKFTWTSGAGTATVKASYGSGNQTADATATINTTAHVQVITYELEVSPSSKTIGENESAQFTATYYTLTDNIRDGGKDVTNSATWSIVSGGSYVKYDDKGDKGKFTWTGGAGTATVKASYNGKEDTATINTKPHVPVETYTYEVVASANPLSIYITETTALSASLVEHKFVDGTEVGSGTTVSGVSFSWTSRTPSVLTVGGSTGTGVAEGTAAVYATCSYGGHTYTSDDVTVTVKNGEDYTIDVWGGISFSLAAGSDAPAKGGATGACTVNNVKQEKWPRTYYYDGTYTDGSHSNVSITGYTVKYSKTASGGFSTACPTYTGSNMGTTVKDRTKLGTVYAYIEANGQTSDTESVDVYQQHNILESHVEQSKTPNAKQYGSWTTTGHSYDTKDYWVSIDADRYTSQSSAAPASGGSATLSWSAGHTERMVTKRARSWTQTAKVTYLDTYTSEATANSYDTVDYDSGTETDSDTGDWYAEDDSPAISGSGTGFSRSGSNVTVSSAGTSNLPSGRSVTYTAKNGSATDNVTLYQEPNVVVQTIESHYEYKDLVLEADPTAFDADGGSSYLDVYAYQRYISQKKVYTSGSYTGGSANSWSTDLHMLFDNYSYAKLTGDSGLSFNLNITDKAVISANTGSARSWNIQATYQDEYSGTLKSNIVTITQEAPDDDYDIDVD